MASKSRAEARIPFAASWLVEASRVTTLAVLVLVLLVFITGVNDVYALPKGFVLAAGGAVLLGIQLWAFASTGTAIWPRDRICLPVAGLVGVMTLSTVLNGHVARSIYGEYGRSAGLLTYAAGSLIFLVILLSFDERGLALLLRCTAGASALIVLYGLVQVAGGEPFGGAPSQGQAISTLGQLNFVAGFTGIAFSSFLWVVLSPKTSLAWRLSGGLMAALTVLLALNTESFQAVFSIGAAAGTVALVFALERWTIRRVAISVGFVFIGVVLGSIVFRSSIEAQFANGFHERRLMWETGVDMVAQRPLLGWGPSGFASHFSEFRPQEHVDLFGLFQLVDAPHDVPLSMFVAGGALLGLSYLAFVVWTGWRLISGLRLARGERRLLLGVFGGGWAAFQVQSLISIDVPPLIASHFVLAGAIVVLGSEQGVRRRSIRGLTGGSRRGRPIVTRNGRLLQAAIIVSGIFAGWVLLRPVVADATYARSRDAQASGAALTQIERLESATTRAPWVALYWADLAAARAAIGDQDNALAAGIEAAERYPSAVSYALSTAQLADRMGRDDIADRYFDKAIANAPLAPHPYRAKAEFYVGREKFDQAANMLRRALDRAPTVVSDWIRLGEVYDAAGESERADAAYREVLEIEPHNLVARQALGLTG